MSRFRTRVGPSLLTSVIIAACGGSDNTPNLVNRTERQLAGETIGVEGGRVEAMNIKLDVPPGALAAPTLVTLSAIDDLSTVKPPPNSQILGDRAWVIGPANLTFAKPATVTITIELSTAPAVGTAKAAAVLFRAEPRTNEWNAGGVAKLPASKLTTSIEHARDLVATLTTTTCFSHVECQFGKTDNQGQPGASTCSISAGSSGVRCASPEKATTNNASCACDGTGDVVATGPMPSGEPAFLGALAMLCGAQCTSQKTCMPVVTCFEDAAVTAPPDANPILWGCSVATNKDTLSCSLDEDKVKVSCVCNSKGPIAHSFSGPVQPTNAQLLELWAAQCDTSCP